MLYILKLFLPEFKYKFSEGNINSTIIEIEGSYYLAFNYCLRMQFCLIILIKLV